MPDSPRAAVVGPINMDLFVRGTAPLDREVLNRWVGPSEVELLVAGSIGYTVQVLARLGCAVAVHSTTGDDVFGEHIRKHLEASGVDCRGLTQARGETAIGIYMMLFGGTKRPLTVRLDSFDPWPDPPPVLRAGEPVPDLVHSGGLLHFPWMWHRGLGAAFEAAHAAGAMTSIDPQFPLIDTPAPWLQHIADVLAHADVLLCDESEARMLFEVEDVASALAPALAAGPRLVVIKRGAQGALACDGSVVVEQAAVPVSEDLVRESVGAGDAFDAGFLDALLRGGALPDAARFATAAAALSLSGRGGAEGIPDRGAVEAALGRVPLGVVRAFGG